MDAGIDSSTHLVMIVSDGRNFPSVAYMRVRTAYPLMAARAFADWSAPGTCFARSPNASAISLNTFWKSSLPGSVLYGTTHSSSKGAPLRIRFQRSEEHTSELQ